MEAIIDLLFAITSSLVYVLWTAIYIGFVVTAFSPMIKFFAKENIKPLFPIFFKELLWYHMIFCVLVTGGFVYKYQYLILNNKDIKIITVICFTSSMLLSFIKKILYMIFKRFRPIKLFVYHIYIVIGFSIFGIISLLTGIFWYKFFKLSILV